jgi:sporulation protein YlmC with PRC-barrel domain
MSIGHNAADAMLPRVQASDSPPVRQDERRLETPAQILDARLTGADDAASFAYVWQLFGYTILDRSGARVGLVTRVWTDTASGQVEFVGVTTGRIRHRSHVIPTANARMDDHGRSITVPYRAAAIRRAPHHNSDISPKRNQQREVDTHYDNN